MCELTECFAYLGCCSQYLHQSPDKLRPLQPNGGIMFSIFFYLENNFLIVNPENPPALLKVTRLTGTVLERLTPTTILDTKY